MNLRRWSLLLALALAGCSSDHVGPFLGVWAGSDVTLTRTCQAPDSQGSLQTIVDETLTGPYEIEIHPGIGNGIDLVDATSPCAPTLSVSGDQAFLSGNLIQCTTTTDDQIAKTSSSSQTNYQTENLGRSGTDLSIEQTFTTQDFDNQGKVVKSCNVTIQGSLQREAKQ